METPYLGFGSLGFTVGGKSNLSPKSRPLEPKSLNGGPSQKLALC